jgi:tetratricopeptide (TPR) repeat protein
MAGRARLWLIFALAGGLAQACQPETLIEACGYRGYAVFGEEIIRACDARLATSGLSARDRAAGLYERARARGSHDDVRALADLDLAIRLDPGRVQAYALRAATYRRIGDLDRALVDYDQVIKIEPEAWNYFYRGEVLSAKGAHQRAIADFDEAIRLRPGDDSFFLSGRADTWLRAGQFNRAISDYDISLRRNPNAISTREGRCWAYAIVGRLDEALADCNSLEHLFSKRTFTARGVVHLKAGRLDDAIADFDAALKDDPRLPRALYGRGIARQRKGEREEAKADVAAAIAIQADIVSEMARYGVRPR